MSADLWAIYSRVTPNHFVFSSLPDPDDVVVVLLSDSVRHIGAQILQDRGGDIVGYGEVLGVTGCAHPAKWTEAQGKYVSERRRHVWE